MKLGVQGELVKKEIEIQARLISTAPTKAEARLLKIMMPIRLKKILFASFIAHPLMHPGGVLFQRPGPGRTFVSRWLLNSGVCLPSSDYRSSYHYQLLARLDRSGKGVSPLQFGETSEI